MGHCFEQFGTAEPYLPLWEALAHLNRTHPTPALATLIERHAPTPDLVMAGDASRLAGSEPRVASERMLRDLADTLESLAHDRPLVLVIEDLHWADYSTLDLVSALARRRGPARLMIVGTFRPGELPTLEHPLRKVAQDLVARRLCCEIAMSPLDEDAVGRYLAARFPGVAFPKELPSRLHQRTGGHPLFLASVIDDLIEREVLHDDSVVRALDAEVPPTVRAVIETQFDRLASDEQRLLEAAVVAGVEFSAAAVAAILGHDVIAVEDACDSLARRHRFLAAAGDVEWPDGTLAAQYRFLHELYHNVVFTRLPAARRAQLHRALAVRLERAWESKPNENAAELALHFEQGRDFAKAIGFLYEAARRATRQYAHREAVAYLRRAVAALDRVPDAPRAKLELPILKSLAVQLQVTEGFAAPEVRQIQARARVLCEGLDDPRATFPVLWGIWLFHKVRSDLRDAERLSRQLLEMATGLGDTTFLLQAYQAISVTSLCLGEPLRCIEQMSHTAAIYDPARDSANTEVYGQDPRVATLAFGAVACQIGGRPDEALAASAAALELAKKLGQPSSYALALHFAAMLHQHRGDLEGVERHARASVELSRWEGFSFWHAGGTVLRNWGRATAGDGSAIGEIRRGIEAWLATGSLTYHTYHLGLLADALSRHGQPREALKVVEQALAAARAMPEGIHESNLHRLKALCLLRLDARATAEEAKKALTTAITVADRQGSASFEMLARADLQEYFPALA
jgi:predicted ATPase